jgi:hypothetical protein
MHANKFEWLSTTQSQVQSCLERKNKNYQADLVSHAGPTNQKRRAKIRSKNHKKIQNDPGATIVGALNDRRTRSI